MNRVKGTEKESDFFHYLKNKQNLANRKFFRCRLIIIFAG